MGGDFSMNEPCGRSVAESGFGFIIRSILEGIELGNLGLKEEFFGFWYWVWEIERKEGVESIEEGI